MDKNRSPITIATGVSLTGTLALVSATPTPLGRMLTAFVWMDYYRGPSLTGRPMLSVEISRDPPDTVAASVTHWSRVPLGDGASYNQGELEVYYEQLDFPSTSAATYHWPSIDVTGAHWLRVYAADKDGVNPGTCAVYLTGGA